MKEHEDLCYALSQAIPGFSCDQDRPLALDQLHGDAELLAEFLGDDFCCYVEWKEFDSWGIEALAQLEPIKAAGVELSVDDLYDEDGLPVSDDADADDPYEFFMPTLQEQLRPHQLQLVEICALENDVATCSENPQLVCVTLDQQAIDDLNARLKAYALALL